MGKSKKNKNYHDYFASADKNDNFGTIYYSMCISKAYQSLSIGAKQFYTLCRVQAKSEMGRRCLFNHGKEEGITYLDNDFVFPASHLKQFNIAGSNANRYFNELIEKGFLKKKEKNNHRKKVNVYSFSSDWKDSK